MQKPGGLNEDRMGKAILLLIVQHTMVVVVIVALRKSLILLLMLLLPYQLSAWYISFNVRNALLF